MAVAGGDSGLSATEGISIAVIFLLLFIFKVNINIPDGGINLLINIQQENNKRVAGNDSNLLIVFYVQIMPDDFVMQLHRF
ncbi:hypothetical protein AAHU47_09975 [Klebsiella pneumoniae]